MEKIKNFFKTVKEKYSSLNSAHKKAIITLVAIVLIVAVLISVVSYINASKTHEMLESGARIEIDCGIRVGFLVDKDFYVQEVYALESKYEEYVEPIKYETDFVTALTYVFNCALDEQYIYNVDYYVVLASVESRNPEMYEKAHLKMTDDVREDGIDMGQIYYCTLAITEYDSEIQRTANRYNVPYSVAYVCLELEAANESLDAGDLMKNETYIISQLANNANGKDKNYFWNFVGELSRKNLNNLNAA